MKIESFHKIKLLFSFSKSFKNTVNVLVSFALWGFIVIKTCVQPQGWRLCLETSAVNTVTSLATSCPSPAVTSCFLHLKSFLTRHFFPKIKAIILNLILVKYKCVLFPLRGGARVGCNWGERSSGRKTNALITWTAKARKSES